MFRVLHILDHSLPLQSGYTFRTRAILKAQQADGLEVRAVTGLRHKADGPDVEETDGLTFHRTRTRRRCAASPACAPRGATACRWSTKSARSGKTPRSATAPGAPARSSTG
jgi:hypothetical protein